jgi:hypothetical protein
MARAGETLRYTNFSGGLVTEATQLNFPENSVRDILNCDIDLRGSARRRLGLGEERGGQNVAGFLLSDDLFDRIYPAGKYGFFSMKDAANPFVSPLTQPSSVEGEEVAVTTHLWNGVAGRGDVNFLVVQVGSRLYVRDLDQDTVSSFNTRVANVPVFDIALYQGIREAKGFKAHGSDIAKAKLASASGFGRLWMTSSATVPFYLEWQPRNNNPEVGDLRLVALGEGSNIGINAERGIGRVNIRDFDGNPTVLNVGENLTPTEMDARGPLGTRRHYYNLLNQGWLRGFIGDYTSAENDKYPSDAQIMIAGKDADGDFDVDTLKKIEFGSTPAPKGRVTYHALTGGGGNLRVVNMAGDTFIYVSATPGPLQEMLIGHDLNRVLAERLQTLGYDNSGQASYADLSAIPYSENVFVNGPASVSGLFNFPAGSNFWSVGAGVPGFTQVAETGFTCCAFFAGRLWLGGESNPGRPSAVYFSRVIKSPKDAGEFQQAADPTSEDFPDLLADDGGVIPIPEAGKIVSMQPFGNGVIIFGSNGIFYISGGETNFAADSFSVDKLSSARCIGRDAVVNAVDAIVFFAQDSIYTVRYDGDSPVPVVQDIAQAKIGNLYSTISIQSRESAWGSYDPVSQKVFWSYLSDKDDSEDSTSRQSIYDTILALDARTGAFYPYSLPTNPDGRQYTSCSFPRRTIIRAVEPSEVVVGPLSVVVNGSQVVIPADGITLGDADNFLVSIKHLFLDMTNLQVRFTEYNSLEFLDWIGLPNTFPIDYDSFIVTGDETAQAFEVNKQATYLHTFFTRTEQGVQETDNGLVFFRPSGCTVQAQWDWHRTPNGGRWGRQQEAYRYRRPYAPVDASDPVDTGDSVVYTKLKVRGKGRSLSLRFQGKTGQDFRLLGYAINATAGGA